MSTESELAQWFVEDLTDYAIVLVDGTGTIQVWNAGARALLGYTAAEALGRSFSELYARLDPPAADSKASIPDAAQWGRHETNRSLVRKNGTRLQANIVLRPVINGSKAVAGFGLIVHDVDRSRLLAAAIPAPPVAAAAAPPVRLSPKILVVDDNHGVLGIAVDQLTDLGYRVLAASSGDEALEVLLQDEQIDMLFTDVVMPGPLAGRALAAKAREMRPRLKVLFSSGYFEGTLVGEGQLDSDVKFLPKPYRKDELARKVEEVLNGAS